VLMRTLKAAPLSCESGTSLQSVVLHQIMRVTYATRAAIGKEDNEGISYCE